MSLIGSRSGLRLGRVPLASALLFDLGVFALVVGATVLILIALAHQSVRKPRMGLPVQGMKTGEVDDRATRTSGGAV